MHLLTCRFEGAERIGARTEKSVTLFPRTPEWPDTMLAIIAAGPELWSKLPQALAHPSAVTVAADAVELLAPIPKPTKNIICLGWNYADHAQESQAVRGREAELPEHPVVFTKNVTSVNAPFGDIPAQPQVTEQLDWEVELGVVIGIGGRAISPGDALRHVFGYTVINDISARDLQFRHKQFFLGKSLDGACPMGPVIVTADEIPDPQVLDLSSSVNGAVKQSSNTRHQVFQVAKTISILSRGMPLEPGDIIATGTPSGVGFARKPPEFLRPGDVVECEIERIGRLRNRVV
jgi:2-keto-4-pentenoate hydratase/2-oxohepta-3-ene-1,7-dioic acid hydratase in catechol pathway